MDEKSIKRCRLERERKMLIFADKIGPFVRIILTPIFLLIRIYHWVWDYEYFT